MSHLIIPTKTIEESRPDQRDLNLPMLSGFRSAKARVEMKIHNNRVRYGPVIIPIEEVQVMVTYHGAAPYCQELRQRDSSALR